MARRALIALVTLLVCLAIAFFSLELAHGATRNAGIGTHIVEFLAWIGAAARGDLGASPSQHLPAGLVIAGRLGVSGPLLLLGLAIAALVGGAVGGIAARRAGAVDKGLLWLAMAMETVPAFWLSLLLSLAFASGLRWFAGGGFVPWAQSPAGALRSLLLPALALGLSGAAPIAIVVRNALVGARRQSRDYAGRARGMTAADAFGRYGRREATLSIVASGAMLVAAAITNIAIVETAFYLPGLGRLLIDAALTRDPVLLRGGLLVALSLSAALLLAVQIGSAWLDPRVRRRTAA